MNYNLQFSVTATEMSKNNSCKEFSRVWAQNLTIAHRLCNPELNTTEISYSCKVRGPIIHGEALVTKYDQVESPMHIIYEASYKRNHP